VRSSSAARFVPIAALLVAATAIGLLRPRLAERFGHVKTDSDVYALPAPEQAIVASLGYRAAFADSIFAHVLVSSGLHLQQKRRFEFVGNYLDTVNALDPKFRDPYRFADTLLTLGSVAAREEDYDKARQILERGLRELPHDGELHSTAGQFMAYLAPSRFKDPEKKKEWRLAGARILARACELVGNEALPYHCITAADLFTRAGEREATIRFLERVLAVTDDEAVRDLALGHLQKHIGEREHERVQQRMASFRERWGGDLPFVTKDHLLVIGPAFEPAACAGVVDAGNVECATSWRDWSERTSDIVTYGDP
jgi:tetratricopeptide (TPR) repeat protein